jgi:hypothetical protein
MIGCPQDFKMQTTAEPIRAPVDEMRELARRLPTDRLHPEIALARIRDPATIG